jgi:hypothetical protein
MPKPHLKQFLNGAEAEHRTCVYRDISAGTHGIAVFYELEVAYHSHTHPVRNSTRCQGMHSQNERRSDTQALLPVPPDVTIPAS